MTSDSVPLAIAVGATGSAPGYCAVTALSKSGTFKRSKIIACDTNPAHLIAASTQATGFIQLPSAFDKDYPARTVEALASRGVSAYYPIHDQEIRAATSARQIFAARGITVCASSYPAVDLATDKLNMSTALSQAGVPTPVTFLLSKYNGELEFPLILKPRRGVGSHGVRLVGDQNDLATELRTRTSSGEELLVQEWLDLPEVTVDAYVCQKYTNVTAVARERIEVKAGITTKARLSHQLATDNLAVRVARALGLQGSFCFQFRMATRDKTPKVIDVNPRIGGATAMSVAAGVDFPSAHVAHFLGIDVRAILTHLGTDVFVTRSFQEHIMPYSP